MALAQTPAPDLGSLAPPFSLPGVDGKTWTREDCVGPGGLVVMFICNHCPFVKAIQARLVEDCEELNAAGVGCAAIMSNDTAAYPQDSFENMARVAAEFEFPFPYLLDESQAVARAYGAVCTPDFFGYDSGLALRYRGRLDSAGRAARGPDTSKELVEAMRLVAESGTGPAQQTPSMGCSIKWTSG